MLNIGGIESSIANSKANIENMEKAINETLEEIDKITEIVGKNIEPGNINLFVNTDNFIEDTLRLVSGLSFDDTCLYFDEKFYDYGGPYVNPNLIFKKKNYTRDAYKYSDSPYITIDVETKDGKKAIEILMKANEDENGLKVVRIVDKKLKKSYYPPQRGNTVAVIKGVSKKHLNTK